MHLDVLDLRRFYYRTRLGRVAQRAIRDQVAALWTPRAGDTVVGFGFAAPLLRPFMAQAARTICLMPGQQGVMPWPAGQPNVSVLCDERHWPLADDCADRLILMHGLETSDRPDIVMEEAYRVLAPGGRALFIVPNRMGVWARRDQTPFGFGRPYSQGQLSAQLSSWGLIPERSVSALYVPPVETRFWTKFGPSFESLGRRVPILRAGGVIMIEVSKQVPAPPRPGLRDRVRQPLRILEGVTQPEAKPV